MKKFKVTLDPKELIIEAESRDEAFEQLGEMVEPDPCGLFEVTEIE